MNNLNLDIVIMREFPVVTLRLRVKLSSLLMMKKSPEQYNKLFLVLKLKAMEEEINLMNSKQV